MNNYSRRENNSLTVNNAMYLSYVSRLNALKAVSEVRLRINLLN